jgi:protein-tyrosine phosphatase
VVDIHSHILFGIDDGASDIEESLEMLKAAQKANVEVLVATPHFREHVLNPEKTYENFKLFKKKSIDYNFNIAIKLGYEIMLSPILETAFDIVEKHDIDDTGYILMEIPHSYYIEQIFRILENLLWKSKFKIIIAHPERLVGSLFDKKMIEKLKEMGCLMQINIGSIKGVYGGKAKKMAKYLIVNRMAEFVASDAHASSYYSWYSEAYKTVIKWSDEVYAKKIFHENGMMLFSI